VRLLSRTFEKTRVVVAFALLLSVSAPLLQYACGVTGEATATSTLVVVETGETDATPCGVILDGLHDLLCEAPQPVPVCDGEACTTDIVDKQSVVHSQVSTLQVISALSVGDFLSKEYASPHSFLFFRSGPVAAWSVRASTSIPIRLQTLSFRL
jgi:hypothetical protein